MKRFTCLLIILAAGTVAAHAQNFVNTGSGVNTVDAREDQEAAGPARSEPAAKVIYADPYSMEHITMQEEDNILHFENLPDMVMTMHITDGNGNEVLARSLSRKNNTARIKGLKKGIHFVTLMSDNTGIRKSFTLNRN